MHNGVDGRDAATHAIHEAVIESPKLAPANAMLACLPGVGIVFYQLDRSGDLNCKFESQVRPLRIVIFDCILKLGLRGRYELDDHDLRYLPRTSRAGRAVISPRS